MIDTDCFVESVNKKREGAWKDLYRKYYPALCNYAMKVVKDPDMAEDVVQECLIRVWDSHLRFEDIPTLVAYLYRAVYTRSLNLIRDKGYSEGLHVAWGNRVLTEQEAEDMIEVAVEEDVVNKFYTAIEELSEQQREVLLMSMQGAKVREIAEKLNISENSVKTQKKRAYAFVRERLGEGLGLIIFLLYS